MRIVRRHNSPQRNLGMRRCGLTLLEMLLAAAILALSLAMLARQNAVGVRAALRTQLETEASVLCQSQLNRLLADSRNLLASIPEQPLTNTNQETHRWMWSARVEDASAPDFRLVTLTVFADGIHRDISTVTLSRLVPAHHAAAFHETNPGGVR